MRFYARTSMVPLLASVFALLIVSGAAAQMPHPHINPALENGPWSASWIAFPDDDGDEFGIYHFRKTFELAEVPPDFVVHVSADNRYRLFVNGTPVAAGPARGDLFNWHFESIDLGPHLQPGKNAVAAVVWNFGRLRPMAQHSYRTAFLMQGDSQDERLVESDTTWRVIKNAAYAPVPVDRASMGYPYIVVGPGERLDGAGHPWGWENTSFDDAEWPRASAVRSAVRHWGPNYGEIEGWRLTPRSIPMMESRETRFDKIVRASGVEPPSEFVLGADPIEVSAQAKATILLDHAVLTTAYPELLVSGGRGAHIKVTYAEALVDSSGEKGNRDVVEGKSINGLADIWLPDGGRNRLFRPLWFRTFRYVQIDVETADEPLTIDDFRAEFTAYPFEEKGRFTSSDTALDPIWDAGWRTARLCAGETYYDCPYYEQLQYVGDTRIQALISLYVSGDDRLMRQAIEAFDQSRLPSGLTQSRYPSYDAQLIPPYSFFWVVMIHDYWMHRTDVDFVASRLNGIRGVIDWYEDHLGENGLIGPTPWWNFVDWSFPRGVPAGADDGGSSIVTLQFVYALDRAAELAHAFGRPTEGARYAMLADRLRSAVHDLCWDEDRRLIADTPAKEQFSQHANVMAVLVDAVPADIQTELMRRVLDDESLTPCSYYYRFYLDEAAGKAGLAPSYVDRLEPWHEMLDLGLTTFAENPEPTRSDAHAWSSSPNYQFLATVCGVRPSSPGFRTVRVEPALGPLEWVRGAIPHPKGEITVAFERDANGALRGRIELPEGVEGELIIDDQTRPLSSGQNDVGSR